MSRSWGLRSRPRTEEGDGKRMGQRVEPMNGTTSTPATEGTGHLRTMRSRRRPTEVRSCGVGQESQVIGRVASVTSRESQVVQEYDEMGKRTGPGSGSSFGAGDPWTQTALHPPSSPIHPPPSILHPLSSTTHPPPPSRKQRMIHRGRSSQDRCRLKRAAECGFRVRLRVLEVNECVSRNGAA